MTCTWANNILVVEIDGYTRPCCLEPRDIARISDISTGISNSWNDKKIIELRNELNTGFSEKTKKWCSRCEELEHLNLPSLRTSTAQLSDSVEIKGIQLKLSNRCQLACAHCGPDLSSTWAKMENSGFFVKEAISKDNLDKFIRDLIPILPNLEWIKFTGGEPWMDSAHWYILEKIFNENRSNCSLKYITNGLASYNSELWKGWKSVDITVSIDGFKETYNWFRRNGDWDKIVDSVNKLNELDVNLDISYSITPWTISNFQDSINFWKFNIIPTPIVFPWYVSIASIPHNIININNDAPFYTMISTKPVALEKLKSWAKGWDTKWATPGKAEQLFPWLL